MNKKPFIENFWLAYGIYLAFWIVDIILTMTAFNYGAVEGNPIMAYLLKFGWVTSITIGLLGIAGCIWILGKSRKELVKKKPASKFLHALPLSAYIWGLGNQILVVILNSIELNRLMS